MTKNFLRLMMVSCLSFTLLAAGMLLMTVKHRSLALRQPRNGGTVDAVISPSALKIRFQAAAKTALEIDKQLPMLVKVSGMGALEKWNQNIDSDFVERRFSQQMMVHLKDMAELMRARRQLGGFAKLQEFEFRSTLSKSDYILSLEVTLSSLNRANHNRASSEMMKQTLASYNHERLMLDRKMLGL
ncbi:hypothetical protein [Bdellovibrio reynosensis]|uniref:Uncharacterized protein n=1 Tax=Bdellovibrio reynosensis TaxID=2835041 RepID=A0ABY4C9J6_9BACT|nr:hypothetical protein [Bdellovibrio reynosensis]UOF01625.1 hypothetical protein MNR06_01490 [Bdellovibrio reynosensis]